MPRVPTMLILATGIKPSLAIVLDDQDKLRYGIPEMDYLGPMDQAGKCGALYLPMKGSLAEPKRTHPSLGAA